MRPRILVLAIAVVLAVAGPTSAVAGGWWTYIDLEHEPIGAGETVRAETAVMFPDVAAAERARARGGYHAYLLAEVDQAMLDEAMSKPRVEGWWDPPAEPIWLAEVTLTDWESNLAHATATFEVPRVATGDYALMFCTDGCREPLADVVPLLEVRVFAEAATASMGRDVGILAERLTQEAERLDSRIAAVNSRGSDTARVVDTDADRLDRIEASLAALTAEPANPTPAGEVTPWWVLTGWFVAGLATAAAAMSWRRVRPAPEEDHDLPPVPDDAGELLTGPPVPTSSIRR